MKKRQEGLSPFIIITIFIAVVLVVGSVIYSLYNKDKSPVIETQVIQTDNQLHEPVKRITDEEAKVIFKATEIVSNEMPSSIKFWTEAYCPGSNSGYDYSIPDGYSVLSCDVLKQEKGTHGGCSTCIMSEISLKSTALETQEANTFNKYWKNTKYYFEYLDKLTPPLFLGNVNENPDIKISLGYNEGERFFESNYMSVNQGCEDERGGCSKTFIMKNKTYKESDYYTNYRHSIFSPETSHTYGGSAMAIKNRNVTVEYVGLKINDISLLNNLQIGFVIDARGGYKETVDELGIINDLFGISIANACGPSRIIHPIGLSDLALERIENGVYWFKLDKPINLNMPSELCQNRQDCNSCDKCHNSCENYSKDDQEYYGCQSECDYGPCIIWPNDFMMFNITYLPSGKSGPLQIQLADLVLKDNTQKAYYVPKLGNWEIFSDHMATYYMAYLVDSHCFVERGKEVPADCY